MATKELRIVLTGENDLALDERIVVQGGASFYHVVSLDGADRAVEQRFHSDGLKLLFMSTNVPATVDFRKGNGQSSGSVDLTPGKPVYWFDGMDGCPVSGAVAEIRVSASERGDVRMSGVYDLEDDEPSATDDDETSENEA